MFKNRSFRVKMVNDKDEPNVWGNTSPLDYNGIVDTISRNVIAGMLLYVGADTARKVIIYAASAKL